MRSIIIDQRSKFQFHWSLSIAFFLLIILLISAHYHFLSSSCIRFNCLFSSSFLRSNHRFFWLLIFLVAFFFFLFLRLYLQHMEVPSLGVKLELQMPATATATAMPDPRHTYDLCHHLIFNNCSHIVFVHWSLCFTSSLFSIFYYLLMSALVLSTLPLLRIL